MKRLKAYSVTGDESERVSIERRWRKELQLIEVHLLLPVVQNHNRLIYIYTSTLTKASYRTGLRFTKKKCQENTTLTDREALQQCSKNLNEEKKNTLFIVSSTGQNRH